MNVIVLNEASINGDKEIQKKLQNFLNYTKIRVILPHIYTVCCRDAYRNHDIFITIDHFTTAELYLWPCTLAYRLMHI